MRKRVLKNIVEVYVAKKKRPWPWVARRERA